ncbi:MAG: NACHT domain-containing protein [Okeania sp. SIO2H7]|nr:NACHT domain-containing protein [Okeania sp. SIO2H7]
MLEEQKRLTTNRIMARDEVTFNLDEMFVDLQLQIDKENHTITFKCQYFLENIIGNKQSQKSQSKRLAILGEPGSGKTTLLLKTADWLLENTEYVPIFISLAEVGKKSLDKYLLEDWLKRAEQKIESASSEWKQALQQLLKSGKVYLLLDGADEMAKADGLYQITNQLKGWADNLRVALTCRVNFWHDNAVGIFDIYWTSKFGEKQLEEFVKKWFSNNNELGNELIKALECSNHDSIKDVVKNPLRLALICYWWQLKKGELPDTQADLYELFLEALYEWNKRKIPTTSKQRKELNKVLGNLALEAFKSEEAKFRLSQGFISKILGYPDTGLFKLALDLGLLRVGVETNNPLETVYVFSHPTFQEYFAAKTIDSWQFFLKHNNENPNPSQGTYRVFDEEWKEVILLWLGREDVKKQQKEDFIQALIDFEDSCDLNYFYWGKGIYLARQGLNEFWKCSLNKVINIDEYGVDLLFHKALPTHKKLGSEYHLSGLFFNIFDGGYRLNDSYLQWILDKHYNELFPAINYMEKLHNINDLIEIIGKDEDELKIYLHLSQEKKEQVSLSKLDKFPKIIRWIAVKRVVAIAKENSQFIADLVKQTYCCKNLHITRALPSILVEISSNNLSVVNALIFLLKKSRDPLTDKFTANNLVPYLKNNSYLKEIVFSLRECLSTEFREKKEIYSYCREVIFFCAYHMTYPEFYYAWHNNSIQTLEKQFVDILSQLQPTDKTYPIAIEASSLKDYTDEEKIANELSYKIYRKVFSKKKNIPQTRDASQLKRLILRITTHLNTENIALILHNCEPNPSLIKFCHRLTDTVNIAWLTDSPLEPPLRGFPPNQINLKSALETWLNEIE